MSVSPPFHLAFAVTDIEATRVFYVEKLGCKVGRSAERWIDFDFFGMIWKYFLDPPHSLPQMREVWYDPIYIYKPRICGN